MGVAQTFMLYSEKQQSELKDIIANHTRNWLERMGHNEVTLKLAISAPTKDILSYDSWFLAADQGIAVKKNQQLLQLLLWLCCDCSQPNTELPSDGLAQRIIHQMLSSWLELLQQPVCLTQPSDNRQSLAHISHFNALLVKITLNSTLIELLIPYNLIQQWLPQRKIQLSQLSSFSLTRLVSNEKIRLVAQLNSIELTFNDLPSLQVGDVLRIPHPLNQQTSLKLTTGETLLKGNLGLFSGQLAIKINNKKEVINE